MVTVPPASRASLRRASWKSGSFQFDGSFSGLISARIATARPGRPSGRVTAETSGSPLTGEWRGSARPMRERLVEVARQRALHDEVAPQVARGDEREDAGEEPRAEMPADGLHDGATSIT
jgi:hypothetical protein